MNKSELDRQVQEYGELRPVYIIYAEVLGRLLSNAARKLGMEAIVQSRAKELSSFAEKAIRKAKEYPEPVTTMNDLCGARVITDRKDQICLLYCYMHNHFQIDGDLPDDVIDRLGTNRFGYRARHLIVSISPNAFYQEIEAIIAEQHTEARRSAWRSAVERIRNERRFAKAPPSGSTPVPVGARFRAEIQVKTLLEHAWASLSHDNQYKGEFSLPARLDRDINRVAAALEEADLDISRAVNEIDSYRSYYGRYMDTKTLAIEREKSDLIFSLDRSNIEVAKRVARLALAQGHHDYAASVLQGFVADWERSECSTPSGGKTTCDVALRTAISELDDSNQSYSPDPANEQLGLLHDKRTAMLFLDYGRALGGHDTALALNYLTRATKLDPRNLYAFVFLGQMYHNNSDLENALKSYGNALDIAQSDPEALYGYICAKIERDHADAFITALRSNIRHAITRCEDRASLGIFDPRVYCQLGLFSIYLDDPFTAMTHFALAVT